MFFVVPTTLQSVLKKTFCVLEIGVLETKINPIKITYKNRNILIFELNSKQSK